MTIFEEMGRFTPILTTGVPQNGQNIDVSKKKKKSKFLLDVSVYVYRVWSI